MKFFLKNSYLLDLIASVMFFTRIPVNWNYFSNKPPNLTKAAWSFPIIGFIVGILSGIFGDLCIFIDLPIFLNRFLKIWNPKALILLETEIWPNLVAICKKKEIFV